MIFLFKSELTNLIINLLCYVILVILFIRVIDNDKRIIALGIIIFSLRAIYDIVKYRKSKTKESS